MLKAILMPDGRFRYFDPRGVCLHTGCMQHARGLECCRCCLIGALKLSLRKNVSSPSGAQASCPPCPSTQRRGHAHRANAPSHPPPHPFPALLPPHFFFLVGVPPVVSYVRSRLHRESQTTLFFEGLSTDMELRSRRSGVDLCCGGWFCWGPALVGDDDESVAGIGGGGMVALRCGGVEESAAVEVCGACVCVCGRRGRVPSAK